MYVNKYINVVSIHCTIYIYIRKYITGKVGIVILYK